MNSSVEPQPLSERLTDYAKLMRLDRPIGIYLLLWPTLWALWVAADGVPSLHVLLVFVLGTALMRSAGCAINDFADRDFDGHVARTRQRPLAAGRISASEALGVFVIVSLAALLLLLSLRNALTVWLAVPAALLAAAYPFAKRFISMPQAVLGVAFSWGIPMAWAAVRHEVVWSDVLLLMGANLCWVVAYDTWYAMADREDDLRIGVKSSAILFGRHDRLAIGVLHAASLLLLVVLGVRHDYGWLYFAGLVVAAALAARDQLMAADRDPARCFAAFLHNNRYGAAVFVGLLLDRWLA